MFLRFRLLSGGKTLNTLNKNILLARTPLKTYGFLIKVTPMARNSVFVGTPNWKSGRAICHFEKLK